MSFFFERKANRLAKQIQKTSAARRKEEKLAALREERQKQVEGLSKAKSRGRSTGGGGFGKFIGGVQSYATKLDQKHRSSGNEFNFNFGSQKKKKRSNNMFDF